MIRGGSFFSAGWENGLRRDRPVCRMAVKRLIEVLSSYLRGIKTNSEWQLCTLRSRKTKSVFLLRSVQSGKTELVFESFSVRSMESRFVL